MEAALAPGTLVSRYRILKRIGAGGMGEVYLAHDDTLDRMVALKILHADVAADEQRMRRFTQEAKTTSALNHPNILTVHEIGQSGETRFIATEFIAGVTLRERMRQGQMDLREILDVAIQVARGLETAHDAGVIHRDIKPENIMLRPDGYVKVLDFGIAKLAEQTRNEITDQYSGTDPNLTDAETQKIVLNKSADVDAPTVFMGNTRTDEILGTVEYLSPEQARALPVDARTDIFSFGIVLYEMIAGRKPFRGHSGWEVITAIMDKQPKPLRRYRPDVPATLQSLTDRALAKDRQQRFQTISDLRTALSNLSEEIDFRAKLRTSKSADTPGSIPGSTPTSIATTAVNPSSSRKVPANNLPLQPTPLIGRKEEVDRIAGLLRVKEVRLITLTGPGGTGKTRLAIESASEMRGHFSDGIYLVSLASVTAPNIVASAVSDALGTQETNEASALETVKVFLGDKNFLLVLDNFEQIISAAFLVGELLAACPQLKILVTSRAVLHLRGEHEFPVPPLALPDPAHLPSTNALAQYPAVALFVDRATAVRRDFTLTKDNARAVAEICARLDGLPLAIELAAARVKLLAAAEILARMEDRLKLLTGGAADLPTRQQTMRGAIDWSFDLLKDDERRLFSAFSVFVNGGTLDAIESVCADPHNASDLLDPLASLVDKSLIRQQDRRFSMLATIREYALEKLVAGGEAAAIREQHARWFRDLIEQAEPQFTEAGQVAWFDRIALEHDNLRAALTWAKENNAAELGLRIAGAMWRFWEVRGHLTEGRKWLESLLSSNAEAPPNVRAQALSRAGALWRDQGDYQQATVFFEEALQLYRELNDKWGIAATLNGIGYVLHEQGDFDRATALYEESLSLFRELGDKRAAAYLLNNLGNVAKEQADYPRAARIHEGALALFRQLTDKRALSASLNNLGEIAQHTGEYDRAEIFHRESLELKRELADTRGIALSLGNLGDVARYRGKYASAATLYQESLALHRDNGDKRNIAHCLEALAEVACAQSNAAHAVFLCAAAATLREKIGAPLPRANQADYERTLDEARRQLREQNFAEQWSRGKTLSLNESIEHALE